MGQNGTLLVSQADLITVAGKRASEAALKFHAVGSQVLKAVQMLGDAEFPGEQSHTSILNCLKIMNERQHHGQMALVKLNKMLTALVKYLAAGEEETYRMVVCAIESCTDNSAPSGNVSSFFGHRLSRMTQEEAFNCGLEVVNSICVVLDELVGAIHEERQKIIHVLNRVGN